MRIASKAMESQRGEYCQMILTSLFRRGRKARRGIARGKSMREVDHTAFFHISAAIKNQKDLASIFAIIGREVLHCLYAHRSGIFLTNGSSAVLKPQFTYAPDPMDGKVGILEEKEIAKRCVHQKRPFLLREPKDFEEFFKYEERDRKITSIMSAPFFVGNRPTGAITISRIDEKTKFTDKDLQFFCTFANHVSIAMQTENLSEEMRKAVLFQKNYEKYMDDILNQLQSLSQEERKRIDEHIGQILSQVKSKTSPENLTAEIPSAEAGILQLAAEIQAADAADFAEKAQVEFDSKALKFAKDLTTLNVFIPTADPKDLGEEFCMRLHLPDGDPLQLTCRVILSNRYGKESQNLRRGMGIKFIDPKPEAQKRLINYLKSLSPKGLPSEENAPPLVQQLDIQYEGAP
jgi:Tfp pilus assembly protein PilZ/polyhydroxyalkanoate synthesis regulator phasin